MEGGTGWGQSGCRGLQGQGGGEEGLGILDPLLDCLLLPSLSWDNLSSPSPSVPTRHKWPGVEGFRRCLPHAQA